MSIDKKTKDVLIIGAGPIGIACALECKKKRLGLCCGGERRANQFPLQLSAEHDFFLHFGKIRD